MSAGADATVLALQLSRVYDSSSTRGRLSTKLSWGSGPTTHGEGFRSTPNRGDCDEQAAVRRPAFVVAAPVPGDHRHGARRRRAIGCVPADGPAPPGCARGRPPRPGPTR